MTTDSRAKGMRAENAAKGFLIKHTGLPWKRIPSSGALSADHKLKGDLYVPGENNKYCIEVKHYKEDKLTSKVLTAKASEISKWWEQAIRQGEQVDKKPLLLFKHDRGKFFVAGLEEPSKTKYIYISELEIYICKLEDWLINEEIVFI